MLARLLAVNLSGCGECKPLAGSSHCLPEQFDYISLELSNVVVVDEVSPLPFGSLYFFLKPALTWQTKDGEKDATKDA